MSNPLCGNTNGESSFSLNSGKFFLNICLVPENIWRENKTKNENEIPLLCPFLLLFKGNQGLSFDWLQFVIISVWLLNFGNLFFKLFCSKRFVYKIWVHFNADRKVKEKWWDSTNHPQKPWAYLIQTRIEGRKVLCFHYPFRK